jgi:hypothetical protein
VVTGSIISVFKDRMEALYSTNFGEHYKSQVTSAAFSNNNQMLYLGTSIGTLHFIDLVSLSEMHFSPFTVHKDKALTKIERFI